MIDAVFNMYLLLVQEATHGMAGITAFLDLELFHHAAIDPCSDQYSNRVLRVRH